jgi:ABC-2 type transport system ATP-binding protein
MANSPSAVDVRDLVVSYGDRRALDGVSLSVPQASAFGLLGPNGSGKSTLLSVAAGLRAPLEGEVLVLGRPPLPAVRRQIGVVFQESCLDPLMTLHETLSLHGRLYGLGGESLRRRIDALLERFGLTDRARDAVRTLSGGLRRRLELARALLTEPKVLLLDEPSTGLDPDSRRALWEHLREARAAGVTLLLATNDVLEAERECDTVAFLSHGHVVAQGAPADLKAGLKRDAVLLECSDGGAAALSKTVAAWPGVGRVTSADATLHVTVDNVSAFVTQLFQTDGAGIRAIRIEPSTLEDAYFAIAGAPLHGIVEEDAS